MKGRKPTDISFKLLAGNPGKRKVGNADEQDPFVQSPVVQPSGLSDLEAQEWTRLTQTLAPILSRASEGMLRVACSAFAQFKTADLVIQEKGMTYETHGESGTVIRLRPEVRVRDSARTQYFRALSELGASPVAMVRVRKLPEKKTAAEKKIGTAKFFTS